MANIPHIVSPFNFGPKGESPRTVQQDTRDDIIGCVENLLRYTIGVREDMPEFGIPDYTFTRVPIPTGQIMDAILKFEPRAAPIIANEFNVIEEMIDRIRVSFQ